MGNGEIGKRWTWLKGKKASLSKGSNEWVGGGRPTKGLKTLQKEFKNLQKKTKNICK